jgi:glucodextranase-like protein/cellulase (glycosyl hydrolase family 5)
MKRPTFYMVAVIGALAAIITLLSASLAEAEGSGISTARDGPGAVSPLLHRGRDCGGAAPTTTSHVRFTVAEGALSGVYSSPGGVTNTETLQYIVTDGKTFNDLQSRDTTHSVLSTDRSDTTCSVASTARNGKYRILTHYVIDPGSDSIVVHTWLQPLQGSAADYQLYVRHDASINGSGRDGRASSGSHSARTDPATTALVSYEDVAARQAGRPRASAPLYGVLRADRPFLVTENGFVGQQSDGLVQLDSNRRLTATYQQALNGNVVQTARLDTSRSGGFTLALGFGHTQRAAVQLAGKSARAPFWETYVRYVRSRSDYGQRNLSQRRGGDSPTTRPSVSAPTATPNPTPVASPTASASPASPRTTSNPVSTPSPTSAPQPPGGSFINRSGTHFLVNGVAARLVGYNYDWLGTNCPGPSDSELEKVFAQIETASRGNIVRVGFYQGGANDLTWRDFDRYVKAAKAHHLYLLPMLVNEWMDCEPSKDMKHLNWWETGYTENHDGYPLSYRSYAQQIASHFANESTIAWWQLANEPDARNADGSCSESTAAGALRAFADDMAATIKAVDANHMVDLGSVSWCGGQGNDQEFVTQGAVDVCDAFHEYQGGRLSMTSYWSGRLSTCSGSGKPSFVGEAGICNNTNGRGDCSGPVTNATLEQRAVDFDRKMAAAFNAGANGYIVWSKTVSTDSPGGWGVGTDDPTEAVVAKYAT